LHALTDEESGNKNREYIHPVHPVNPVNKFSLENPIFYDFSYIGENIEADYP